MKISIYELFERTASKGVKEQASEGNMLAGSNGPYYHNETPVRNTACWLMTFSKVFELTAEKKYKMAAERAIKYLTKKEVRPYGKTFFCRRESGKDFCNGLIGQAWVIEALAYAGRVFNYTKVINLAKEVFFLHEFNDREGLWYIHEVDRRTNLIDPTLNHQITFAASGVALKSHKVDKKLAIFLDRLDKNFSVNRFGIIKHLLRKRYDIHRFRQPRMIVTDALSFSNQLMRAQISKEIGYHQFNIFNLAMLFQKNKKHVFWSSKAFQKSLQAICSKYYISRLEKNIYGYPYNVAGIESAFILEKFFPQEIQLKQKFLDRQFTHYDTKANLLRLNTSDPETLAARICEAIRLKDTDVNIS